MLNGSVPDLRYMPQEVHLEWHAIVLGGIRADKGMLGFFNQGVTMEDSTALQAYVIDMAWKAYNAQQKKNAK
jgi:hypothetical protein